MASDKTVIKMKDSDVGKATSIKEKNIYSTCILCRHVIRPGRDVVMYYDDGL